MTTTNTAPVVLVPMDAISAERHRTTLDRHELGRVARSIDASGPATALSAGGPAMMPRFVHSDSYKSDTVRRRDKANRVANVIVGNVAYWTLIPLVIVIEKARRRVRR